MPDRKISVIIPVLNEVASIVDTISRAMVTDDTEVIIVDGGSTDGTLERIINYCWHSPEAIQLLRTHRGRAHQMNYGAAFATGEILLFLHADTQLPENYQRWIHQVLAQSQVVAGAFELKILASMSGIRWVERGVRWRSHWLQMPYGDQAIFLRANIFQHIGGFPDLPLMEDFELIRQLKQRGRIGIAPVAVRTSGRRWQQLGVCRTTLVNQLVILGYRLGIAPGTLASWYRGQFVPSASNWKRKTQDC
ncbi:MAG: TIGR04283 family arsenosugar biosynthesis glycosyltransferase [Microcoleaceae cyanobacterium]